MLPRDWNVGVATRRLEQCVILRIVIDMKYVQRRASVWEFYNGSLGRLFQWLCKLVHSHWLMIDFYTRAETLAMAEMKNFLACACIECISACSRR